MFAAGKTPIVLGDLAPPDIDPSSISNWLHVYVDGRDLEIVGFRFPAYERAADRRRYREQLRDVLTPAASRRMVVCGDFNFDPFTKAPLHVSRVEIPWLPGFGAVRPEGPWSYINHRGTAMSRVDRVMHTARVVVRDAHYHYAAAGATIAAPTAERPLSDHAALTFEVDTGKAG